MNVDEYVGLFKPGATALKVFNILKDKRFHCRGHDYSEAKSGQLAGSGGIQGLQRGTRERPGLEIQSERRPCKKCKRTLTFDRWTGKFMEPTHMATLSPKLIKRILALFEYTDAVDQKKRPLSELTIDHKFPMARWPKDYGDRDSDKMTDAEIRSRYQLLKKSNGTVSHNLLKSRACEHCIKTRNRGTPFGIRFFHEGTDKFIAEPQDEMGCHGCGWYDFDLWRKKLNRLIESKNV